MSLPANHRAVIDTNTLVSGILSGSTTPAFAVDRALRIATVLRSPESSRELQDVFLRDKFDRYISKAKRSAYLGSILARMELVDSTTTVTICRDPKDNKILALAIDGAAHVIITGDKDLLVLHPFQGISILSPAEYLTATTI